MLPKGSNAVIMEEDTEELGNNMIEIKKSVSIGENIIYKGEEIKKDERIINKGANNAKGCVEQASGAKHTEAELKATKRSEINPECPTLTNPSYVPYE